MPKGYRVRLKTYSAWFEQGSRNTTVGWFDLTRANGNTLPDSVMEGKSITLVLPEMEINGVTYPPVRIPFRTNRTFRLVPMNGC